MNRHFIQYLINPFSETKHEKFDLVCFDETEELFVKNGILIGKTSHQWFPVIDEILYLLPHSLIPDTTFHSFTQKFNDLLNSLKLERTVPITNYLLGNQNEQQKFYDDFQTDNNLNYNDFENFMFWKVIDARVFKEWNANISSDNSLILDLGCGNGRSSMQIDTRNRKLVGIDISPLSVKNCIERSKKTEFHERRLFFVGDATYLPFGDEIFDAVITSGVMSQLPFPEITSREILRILKKGGLYLGMENNKSIFRLAFDLITYFTKKWKKNITGKIPLFDKKILFRLFPGTEINYYTTVFVSPVKVNKIKDFTHAQNYLQRYDRIFCNLGFKNHGGLIIYSIKKI
ncbi:MAG: class I SAM-dependent methyltransferase [Bacteroidia bacterium]|nr:class I SAM-dependent methyltransferase [Bacteroidia bacterium]